jgi:phosphotransferase system enzyme I (PtsI)
VPHRKTIELVGRPVSGGIAIGRAEIHLEDPSVVPEYALVGAEEIEAELRLFADAREAADREAQADVLWAHGNLPESEAEIFEAQRAILRDPSLVEWVETRIRDEKINAAAAIHRRFDEFRAILGESSSEIIRNRILDVTDAERLILSHVLGHAGRRSATDGAPAEGGRVIVITADPPPSLLARVDTARVAGIVCEKGAGMGHVAVLARALNLPTILQVDDLLEKVREGEMVAVDAEEGRILVNPTEDQLAKLRARERQRRILQPPAPSDPRRQRVTRDGRRIFLVGNVGSQREVDACAQSAADGIGLYRSEFLYLARERVPSEEELVATYSAAACSFVREPVDVRLADLGSDKHLPGTRVPAERNPALGLRGLRFLFAFPEIMRAQIRAILQASADGPLRLLLPMVSGPDDVVRVRGLVEECHEELRREGRRHNPDLPVGAMIETPAAAVLARAIAEEADFVSIGTNDLTMYILAVDRDGSHLSAHYDPFHPAFLRTLRSVVDAGRLAGKSVSVCGEIASDPTWTGLLVGLGVERLSMAPQWILPIGQVVAELDAGRCAKASEQILTLSGADEIRRRIRELAVAA